MGDDEKKVLELLTGVVKAMRADLSGDPAYARHPQSEYILGTLFDERPALPEPVIAPPRKSFWNRNAD